MLHSSAKTMQRISCQAHTHSKEQKSTSARGTSNRVFIQKPGLAKCMIQFLSLSAPQNDPVKPGKSISKTLIHVKYYFLEPEIQSLAMKTKSTLINVPFNSANRTIFRLTHSQKKPFTH